MSDIETALVEELHRIAPEADLSAIDRDANMREELDIDSMDFLNLVTALHRRYGIPIPETDYVRLSSVASTVAYLREKTGQA